MANRFVAYHRPSRRYLGKTGIHKDASVRWDTWPTYYPTKAGVVRSAKEKLNTYSFSTQKTIGLNDYDIEIREMSDPDTIVNVWSLDTL